MKVGDYVRTRSGCIAKFERINESFYEFDNIIMDESSAVRDELFVDIVEKSSPNIIDLIEENDLIEIEYKISTGENQKEIVQVIKNVNNKLFIKTYTEHYAFIEDIEKTIYKIKGIITHEQIESMEYKVKE